VAVVGDATEFLRARGHPVDELTDYELRDAFESAFRNWQHGLVEAAFYNGLSWVANPRDWKKYCDALHHAIEGRASHNAAEKLLRAFRDQRIPETHHSITPSPQHSKTPPLQSGSHAQ
jgi:hypothetical protein